jgi:hypothetical protein
MEVSHRSRARGNTTVTAVSMAVTISLSLSLSLLSFSFFSSKNTQWNGAESSHIDVVLICNADQCL